MLFPFDTRGAAKDLAGFPHKNVESKPTIIYADNEFLVKADDFEAGFSRYLDYSCCYGLLFLLTLRPRP